MGALARIHPRTQLRADVQDSVYAACGVPEGLAGPEGGRH